MSDAKKIRNYQKSRQPKPPISKAEHRANCEQIVDDLMPIIEKMRKSPADIQPVKESFDDLLFEMRNGVKRQPFIVNAGGRRLAVCDDEVIELEYQPTIIDSGGGSLGVPISDTKIIVGGAENSPENKFTETELQILKQFDE
jgi:hypothetical protein